MLDHNPKYIPRSCLQDLLSWWKSYLQYYKSNIAVVKNPCMLNKIESKGHIYSKLSQHTCLQGTSFLGRTCPNLHSRIFPDDNYYNSFEETQNSPCMLSGTEHILLLLRHWIHRIHLRNHSRMIPLAWKSFLTGYSLDNYFHFQVYKLGMNYGNFDMKKLHCYRTSRHRTNMCCQTDS